MPELEHSEIQIMVLIVEYVRRKGGSAYEQTKEMGFILTPTHATDVFRLLSIGTM